MLPIQHECPSTAYCLTELFISVPKIYHSILFVVRSRAHCTQTSDTSNKVFGDNKEIYYLSVTNRNDANFDCNIVQWKSDQVVLANGSVVRAKQVLSNATPAVTFLVRFHCFPVRFQNMICL